MKAVAGIAASAGIRVVGNKKKKCKWSGVFVEASTGVQTPAGFFSCWDNAIKFANDKGQKKARIAQKRAKVQRKRDFDGNDRSRQLRIAQAAFNKFIRQRDADDKCISCGRHHTGQYHAGHYRSVGAISALRFNQFNVSKQCSACNNHLSGNAIEYRISLVKKFGAEKVEWLEGNHEPKKWTLDEIKAIGVFYKTMLRGIKE